MKTRRQILKMAAAGTLASASRLYASPITKLGASAPPRLKPVAFQMLPLGKIKPSGWLLRQLRVQAHGLSGHLDETWDDVGPESGWLGGTGESWERGPYYLDGLVPLAYLLEDDTLKAKAQRFVEWVLTHQQESGMLGPVSNDDWWPRMVLVKALAQYYEATNDQRVLPALRRYFLHQLSQLPGRPLAEWGKYRWQDEALVLEWLYERQPDPRLLQLAELLRQQGFDWVGSFADFRFTEPTKRSVLQIHTAYNYRGMQTHGVNNGQALKTSAVQYRLSGDPTERANLYRQLGTLDRYHGEPNGMFSCDEHLAGLSPSQGTELCTVVETMFSLEVALSTFGDAALADRIEKIAFNALPGAFTEDMWAHQYDQQSNQVQAGLNTKPWTTNGPESNLFGLAPNFGCCTANFHQGWPKLIASLWMRTPDDGLVATMYSPCAVNTKVRGTDIRIFEETDYPFHSTIRVRLEPRQPVSFPLLLRIPAWAGAAEILVNGEPEKTSPAPGSFLRMERPWKFGDTIEVRLPMPPRLTHWFNGSVAVERGPLVFSLSPGESWVKLRDRGMTADWQVFPSHAWNYGLAIGEDGRAAMTAEEHPVPASPFSAKDPAVVVKVAGRRLNAWRSADGVAPPPPAGPHAGKMPLETLDLVSYASAKLRITAFPQVSSESAQVTD